MPADFESKIWPVCKSLTVSEIQLFFILDQAVGRNRILRQRKMAEKSSNYSRRVVSA